MNTFDDLNRIKLANTILNRSSNRLGVRPLYIGEMLEAERKSRNVDMKIVAAKLSQEKFLRNNKTNLLKSISNFARKLMPRKPLSMLLSISVIVALYLLIFVFNATEPKASTKSEILTQSSKQSDFIFDNSTKPMIITSRILKNLDEAKRYQEELSKRLDMDLKILHDGNYYTIQIGPSYKNRDDAMLVYDEISRFSIPGLALRY